MTPLRRFLAVGLLALAATACIDYQETIEVRRDGSVEISVFATVARGGLKLAENRPELQQLLLLPPNPLLAREMLPESVGIKHWVIREGPGIRIYDLAITLSSLDDAHIELSALAGGDNVRIYRDGDVIMYRRRIPSIPLRTQIARGKVAEALAESRLEFRLKVPTRIVETNGLSPTPQEAVWRTDLLRLRQSGVELVAAVEPPGPPPWIWAVAAGAAVLAAVGVAALVRRRRRRRFDAQPRIE